MTPKVVCVCCSLPSRRNTFLKDSIRQFAAQTHPNKALFIHEDTEKLRGSHRMAYLHEQAWTRAVHAYTEPGTIFQKWDDDDLYSPEFLAHSAASCAQSEFGVSAWARHRVQFADGSIGIVTRSAGGTIAMTKAAFCRFGFWRPSNVPELYDDGNFFQRSAGSGMVLFEWNRPELYTYVRHSGNVTTTSGLTPDVDRWLKMLAQLPPDRKSWRVQVL